MTQTKGFPAPRIDGPGAGNAPASPGARPEGAFKLAANQHELEPSSERSVQKSEHGCIIENTRRPALLGRRGLGPNLDQGIPDHVGEPSAEKSLVEERSSDFDDKATNHHNGSETFRQVGSWWCFWFKPLSEPYKPEPVSLVAANEYLGELRC